MKYIKYNGKKVESEEGSEFSPSYFINMIARPKKPIHEAVQTLVLTLTAIILLTINLHIMGEEVELESVNTVQAEEYDALKELIKDAPEIEEYIEEPKGDDYVIEQAMEFIKQFEGVHYTAYHDYKQFSICYGTRSTKGATATHEECEQMLRERVQGELLRINRIADNLEPQKKIALISFMYNVGYRIDVLRYAARGDDASVIYLMSLYNSAGGRYLQGLQNRRYKEIDMYQGLIVN